MIFSGNRLIKQTDLDQIGDKASVIDAFFTFASHSEHLAETGNGGLSIYSAQAPASPLWLEFAKWCLRNRGLGSPAGNQWLDSLWQG